MELNADMGQGPSYIPIHTPIPFDFLIKAGQMLQDRADKNRDLYDNFTDKAYNIPSLKGPDTEYKKSYIKDIGDYYDNNLKGKSFSDPEVGSNLRSFIREKSRDEGIHSVLGRYNHVQEANKNKEALVKEKQDNPANYYPYYKEVNDYTNSDKFDKNKTFGDNVFSGDVNVNNDFIELGKLKKPFSYKYDNIGNKWIETTSGKQLDPEELKKELAAVGLPSRAMGQLERNVLYQHRDNIKADAQRLGMPESEVAKRYVGKAYEDKLAGISSLFAQDDQSNTVRANPYGLQANAHALKAKESGDGESMPQIGYTEGVVNNQIDENPLKGTPAEDIKFDQKGNPIIPQQGSYSSKKTANLPAGAWNIGSFDNTKPEDRNKELETWISTVKSNNPSLKDSTPEQVVSAYKQAREGLSKTSNLKHILHNTEANYFTKQILNDGNKVGDILGRSIYVSDSRGNPVTAGDLGSALNELGYNEEKFLDLAKNAKVTSIVPNNSAVPGAFQVTLLDNKKRPRNILISPSIDQQEAFQDAFSASQLENKGETGELVYQGTDGQHYVAETKLKKDPSDSKYKFDTRIYGAVMMRNPDGSIAPAKDAEGHLIRDTRFQSTIPELTRKQIANYHNSKQMSGIRGTFKKNETSYDSSYDNIRDEQPSDDNND